MNKKANCTIVALIVDWIACILAWSFFFFYRKFVELGYYEFNLFFGDPKLYLGLLIIPLCWILLFWFGGFYDALLRKEALSIVFESVTAVIFGSLIMLFTILFDDLSLGRITYTQSFAMVLLVHIIPLLLTRLALLSYHSIYLSRGKIRFKAILITDIERKGEFVSEFGGSIDICSVISPADSDRILSLIKDLRIEELIIDVTQPGLVSRVINATGWHADDLYFSFSERAYTTTGTLIRVRPIILQGRVALRTRTMSRLEENIKRLFDITFSLTALVILTPLVLFIALKVRISSKGPVIYAQERVGKKGRKFVMRKFRSMWYDAERSGPQLSVDDDMRCTPWGKVMRKWRLDEIPQFWNVIIGDMSLVGPRPERQHFIDQIKKRVAHFDRILQLRPGITSWGQIRFGYASNIDEMVKRLRFDMLYLDNYSLFLDFKILLNTLVVLFQGKGK